MATIYRAYHTAEDFRKYRFFTIYVTVLLALTVVLVHLAPSLFPWVITLYLTWSPWHYTGQNFGIAQMFIRRSGAPPDTTTRNLLWTGYAATYGGWFLTLHAAREAGDQYFLSLGIPASIATPLQILFVLVFLGCTAAAFIRMARHLPWRILVAPAMLTLTQMLWFVAPALLSRFGNVELPASYFSAGALAFMHCAQYLWITTYYARRESAPAGRTFSFARYYLTLIVGGMALFIPGPWIASRLLGHDFVESFMIFMALVNLHHFMLDGAIWKLRDGRIARLLLGKNAPPAETLDKTGDQKAGMSHHLGWLFGPARPARFVRYSLGGAIIALGALDQWQYFATSHAANAATLARATAVNPSDTRPYFRHAQLLAAEGKTADARREIQHVLAINPYNAPANYFMGELLFRSGDTASALAQYDRMASLFRPDFIIASNRGLLDLEHNRPADAVARFTEAMRIAPDRTDLHFFLAEALVSAGNAQQAIAQYESFTGLLEQKPTDPETNLPRYLAAAVELGKLYEQQNEPDRAEQWLQRAANLATTQHYFKEATSALTRLAALQEKLGRTTEAEKNRMLAKQTMSYIR
jgi:tetratricopeptide (TPR) repeat protein